MNKPIYILPAEAMYWRIYRMHSMRFLIALAMLSWFLIGSLVLVYFGLTMAAIWSMLASVFLTVVCLVEYKLCEEYYDKWARLAAKGLPKIDYIN